MKLKTLSLAVALVLSGCSLIPDYQRPEADIPASWPQGAAYAAPAKADDARLMAWQSVFQDPALQRLVDQALASNTDLRQAALNVEAYRALHRIQRAEQFPQVESIHAKFEELPAAAHEGRYGTVVTSESLQYLKLDQALPLLARVLKPGGRWVACDYFRTTEPPASTAAASGRRGSGGARERSGHFWDAFVRRVRDDGWEVTLERDITPNVLPTLRYLHMWGERFGMPLLGYVVGRLRRKQPGLHYVLENVLNEVESVLTDNLQIVDPAIFAARKRYMLLVMTRR